MKILRNIVMGMTYVIIICAVLIVLRLCGVFPEWTIKYLLVVQHLLH